MKLFILIAFVFCFVHSVPTYLEDAEWITWKNTHGKVYEQHEESHRRSVWEENKRFVLKHNYQYDIGVHTYKVGMNKFADLTNEEFRAIYVSNGMKSMEPQPFCKEANTTQNILFVADEVDWRTQGYVTPVKNQEQCGSCWAFSATGSLEGQWFKKTGKLVSLSEQNLVDCSTKQGNAGCLGGFPDWAYRYINKNKGIDTESSYPYTAMDGDCKFDASNIGATVDACVAVVKKSEENLQKSVATIGPISVAIDAGHQSFQLYEEGVYYEPECSEDLLDHGVLAVGYGSDDNGQQYWLVKNSWGEDWGNMGGYIWMARNRNNNCGISSNACYPIV